MDGVLRADILADMGICVADGADIEITADAYQNSKDNEEILFQELDDHGQ